MPNVARQEAEQLERLSMCQCIKGNRCYLRRPTVNFSRWHDPQGTLIGDVRTSPAQVTRLRSEIEDMKVWLITPKGRRSRKRYLEYRCGFDCCKEGDLCLCHRAVNPYQNIR